MGTSAQSKPPASSCLGILQQAVPVLHVHFFPLRLNGDSSIRQTQKHVDVNERPLPKRKRVMGLPWAALAWCAALGQDSWVVSSGLGIVRFKSVGSQARREADGSCLPPLGREVSAGSGREDVKASSLRVTRSLTVSGVCHRDRGSLVVIVAPGQGLSKIFVWT